MKYATGLALALFLFAAPAAHAQNIGPGYPGAGPGYPGVTGKMR
jgi:hypothetical protein